VKTIAYLANQYPNCIENYVTEEIVALRNQGVTVLPYSVFGPPQSSRDEWEALAGETVYLSRIRWLPLLRAVLLCLGMAGILWEFWKRALFEGHETFNRRLRALAHTLLGAYYAVLLSDRGVDHIHVHHGYFSAWIAMVAARLLNIGYSMTLHGSDLLVHHSYLDIKLKYCDSCFTISEYNRQFIRSNYPSVEETKLLLRRLGVAPPLQHLPTPLISRPRALFVIMSVGRLHKVKNQSFLVDACAILKSRGIPILCLIAGDGPERRKLENRIATWGLEREVKLLGHVAREDLDSVYGMVDLVTLTSKSEGIPLSLMEAMSHERIVLAPAITGLPELVIDGETGFLYKPDSLTEFVARVEHIRRSSKNLESIQFSARDHVRQFFDREQNLQRFTELFLQRISPNLGVCNENPVLQQI